MLALEGNHSGKLLFLIKTIAYFNKNCYIL